MSQFFKTLSKESNDSNALEFLRTHPLSKSRIVETQNLAAQYKGNFISDSFAYQFTSAKLSIRNINTRDFIENYAYDPKAFLDSPGRIIDDYAYSLALTKEKKYDESASVLLTLLKFLETQDRLFTIKNHISIALSDSYVKKGDHDKAISILEGLNNIYPNDSAILYYLSDVLIQNKEYKKVINKLIPYVIEHKDHRLVIKISEAAYKLKEKSLAHEYRGDYLKMLGSLNSAIKYYKLALKYNMKGETIDKRITSKIKEIEKLKENKEIL